MSRNCLRKPAARVVPDEGVKGKEIGEHGPEERRMGLNGRGSQDKNWWPQVEAIGFDYTKSVEETIRERRTQGGPIGAQARWGGYQ